MKVLHFDCFAGISGDMTLGALIDLGVDASALRAELEKLSVSGWQLDFVRDERCGIAGTRAIVTLENDAHEHEAPDAHHTHEHNEHDHHDHHDHHGCRHGGAHNSWREIKTLIEKSAISDGAKRRALDIFTRIARAEAEVHNTPLDEVTFHEVGALDSIIDVVGAAICLDILRPDRITAGPVELGGGTVHCAHGELPVPAPATLLLVRGMPVTTGGFDKEMTTPTGAGILAASVDEFVTQAAFTEIKTGCGIGGRKMNKPNVLRVSWREYTDENTHDWLVKELVMLEANIDDMNGEELGFLLERLFDAGALDVTISPCVMKKSRPAHIVAALSPPEKLTLLRETFFAHSSTIGFRESLVRRVELKREETRGSDGLRRKTSFLDGKPLRTKIEFEDRAKAARERNCSLAEIGGKDTNHDA